jgi:hypothetical protein
MSSSTRADIRVPSSTGSHSTEAYQYTILKERQIRLLVIHPGAEGDIVSCSLEVVDIDRDNDLISPASCGTENSELNAPVTVHDVVGDKNPNSIGSTAAKDHSGRSLPEEAHGDNPYINKDPRTPGFYDALSYVWGYPGTVRSVLCQSSFHFY